MTKPFRFGVQQSKAGSAKEWADLARRAEDLGYSTLSMPDHFVNEEFAPVPGLMAAADATETLRVGTLVWDNDYKHPVVLAKEAATLDVLSDGRLEFGLGAGWQRDDYEKSGIPYDEPSVRVERFEEALTVIKGLWSAGPFSFSGKHYEIAELDGFPKPLQQRPPVLIGGGSRRVLRIAGREADVVGINPSLKAGEVTADAGKDMAPEMIDRKLEWVREGAGERFSDLEFNALVFVVVVTDDRQGMMENMAPAFGLSPEEAGQVPLALVGTVEEICDQLEARRDRWGFNYVTVQGPNMELFAPVVARLAGT